MTTEPDAPQVPSDAPQVSSGPPPAEQLQRRLVQDVRAYEVDPPAPDRAAQEQSGRE
ncbi:MAG: hypothetical protein JWN57_366 [Frankiales bacterium]|jgi:hypothetical protein|nr:hypothetical protein [Frankiales bacterium]